MITFRYFTKASFALQTKKKYPLFVFGQTEDVTLTLYNTLPGDVICLPRSYCRRTCLQDRTVQIKASKVIRNMTHGVQSN